MTEQGTMVLNGRYEIHSQIARGGMAEVFLARDQLLDRPVAIKILFPEFASDEAFVERFRREAQSAANLTHPNIVGVYDWGSHSGTYFIVMEYVNGRTLAEILRGEGTLHPDRAADIGIDIAGALYFAHRNGVVHRDVKPGNVLISPSGQVKVTDFGIARAMGATTSDDLTQTGAVMGTATYFSPEQAQGFAVDPRTDLYSLGVVLYEMVTGQPPFRGDSPVAIAYKHVQDSPEHPRTLNPAVPAPLEAIILKLLAKNRANRYASAEELRADLRRFREGRAVAAEPVMAPPVDGLPAVAGRASPAPADVTTTMATTDATRTGTPVYVPPATYDPPKRPGVFFAVLVVLLLALAGLLFAFARTLGVGSADSVAQIEVPDVVGLTEELADAQLRGAGFRVRVDRQENEDHPAGEVFGQDPVGRAKAARDSEVTIQVSLGDSLVPVPEVIGTSEQEASRILREQGFVVLVKRVNDDTVPVDDVIDQDPAPGQSRERNSEVTLFVSLGLGQVEVPQVAGKTPEQASAELGRAGFEVQRGADVASAEIERGLVVATDPPVGTSLDAGEVVTLLLSAGPEVLQMPDVVGVSKERAEQILFGLNATVKVDTRTYDPDDPRVGVVVRQSPTPGTDIEKLETVTITVGVAKPGTTTTTTTTAATTTTTTTTSPSTSTSGPVPTTTTSPPPEGG